jgi:hypothetical protein
LDKRQHSHRITIKSGGGGIGIHFDSTINTFPGPRYHKEIWKIGKCRTLLFLMSSENLKLIFLCTGGAYYVPYSCLLISNKFCNGEERPEPGEQVPLCACSFTPLSMGPETSLMGSLHKTTYAPMIYTALCIMFWMRVYPFLGQVGGGRALEISRFLCPKFVRIFSVQGLLTTCYFQFF